jgi:hypothetical protein
MKKLKTKKAQPAKKCLIRLDDGRVLSVSALEAEIAKLKQELKERRERDREESERQSLIDNWIREAEGGKIEDFPFMLEQMNDDGTTTAIKIGGMEDAAKAERKPVELWETGFLMLGSPHCASQLMELVRRTLMVLGMHSRNRESRERPDKSTAGALLGKFYAEIARGVHEVDRVKKDREGKRDLSAVEPKNFLLRLLGSNLAMQASYEAETKNHHREGWAGDAADVILRNLWVWNLWTRPTGYGIAQWAEKECELILSPNPLASSRLESAWELVWCKEEFRMHLEASNAEANERFRNEWRTLWTDERLAALATYHHPKTNCEFVDVWKALYEPLANTIPLPTSSKMTKADRHGGRSTSVRDALRVRLGLPVSRENT